MKTCSNCDKKNSENNNFCIYCGFQLGSSVTDLLKNSEYYQLPGSLQSFTLPKAVDKTEWQPCHNCSQHIPVEKDWLVQVNNLLKEAGTYTYVCPFCSHCHVGTPDSLREDIKQQHKCHECGTELVGDIYQCPQCRFPKAWKRVSCFYCGNKQPACLPHWVVMCDTFTLSCVRCERVSSSLCIC